MSQYQRFVNNLMLDGKKSIAYTIFYDSLELVGKKMKDTLNLRWKSGNRLENITPQVEVKSKRIGGATFQVPMEVRPGAQDFDFYEKPCPLPASAPVKRWLRNSLPKSWMPTTSRVPLSSVRRMHRMAEANKAFAHFRF